MHRRRALFRDSYSLQYFFIKKTACSLQFNNAWNEGNLPLPRDVQQLKPFQLQGASPPLPPTRGSAHGPRWGLCPQTPVIGSRSALAMSLSPPKLKILATSLNVDDRAVADRTEAYTCRPTTACSAHMRELKVQDQTAAWFH